LLKRFKDKKVDRDWLNTNFPCMMACPAHTNAGRYVSLIAEGRFEEAYKFARDPNPLASICGEFALIPVKPPAPWRYRSPHFHPRAQALPDGAARARIQASCRCLCGTRSAQAALQGCRGRRRTCGTLRGARPGAHGLFRHDFEAAPVAGECSTLASPNTSAARRGGGAGARNSRDRRHYSQAQSRRRTRLTVPSCVTRASMPC